MEYFLARRTRRIFRFRYSLLTVSSGSAPNDLLPKGLKNLAQGLPWGTRSNGTSPEGATEDIGTWFLAHRQRVPLQGIRQQTKEPRVNPGLCFLGPSGQPLRGNKTVLNPLELISHGAGKSQNRHQGIKESPPKSLRALRARRFSLFLVRLAELATNRYQGYRKYPSVKSV
jgi:hypothetical protein